MSATEGLVLALIAAAAILGAALGWILGVWQATARCEEVIAQHLLPWDGIERRREP